MKVELTPSNFEVMKKVFEEQNPQLAGNPDAIRERIADFDEDIQKNIERQSPGFEGAVSILWQGRNFLARYIGDEETPAPDVNFGDEEEEEVKSLLSKYVVIYVSHSGPFNHSIQKVLSMHEDTLRMKFYGSIQEVIDAMIAGDVCGIIGVQLNKEADIERHIRHDLKNMPDWDYEKANEAILPPCADFVPPHQLVDILKAIYEMQEGKYNIQEDQEFDLNDELSSLVSRMEYPSQETKIAIVDDQPNEIRGMVQILEAWPKVSCISVIQKEERFEHSEINPDVWLLDEDMPTPAKRGSEYAQDIRCSGSSALIASTTGGEKPKLIDFHFCDKVSIRKKRSSAEGFIRFINKLLLKISENNLAELEIRAQKALKHERSKELINIARTMSPTSAMEASSDLVDEETAKSCRFLAKLRRDHGSKIFEKVISRK
jgi:DNA-binding NarL/FixJ family response regulator